MLWAGYTRVSRVGDRGDNLISHDLQRERVSAFAKERGLRVEFLPEESDVSGGAVSRPVLDEALKGIEAQTYAGIIVAQLDRLSRMEIADAALTIQRIEIAGGQVLSVGENFDTTTPEGEMARNVMLSMNNMRLKQYRNQFRHSKENALQRKVAPQPKCLGYSKEKGRGLVLKPKEAKRVRAGFEARAEGKPWSVVSRLMGCSYGGAQYAIRNRTYLGELRLGDTVVPNAHEAIVSRELFEAAQVDHPRPPRGAGQVGLLAKMIRCASCGNLMSPSASGSGKRPDYRCVKRGGEGMRCTSKAMIRRHIADEYVVAQVSDYFHRLAPSLAESNRDSARALTELDAAEAELRIYQETMSVSGLGADVFIAGMKSRAASVEQAREKVARTRGGNPLPEVGRLHEEWPNLTVADQRHILRSAIKAVYVTSADGNKHITDRITVVYHDIDVEPRVAAADDIAVAAG